MSPKKRGRPRKAVVAIDPIAPAAWQRIRQMVEVGALDPIHATELGRLSYHGEITSTQMAAGLRIGEIYGRYERSIGRRRSARSPSYEIGFGQSPDPESTEGEIEQARAARHAWDLVQALMPTDLARAMIEDLCVEDRAINSLHLDGIRTLLDRAAAKFGTTTTGKAPVETTHRRPTHRANGKPAPAAAALQHRVGELDVWRIMLAKLRPDLDDDQALSAFQLFTAMKDRARLRRLKVRPTLPRSVAS